MEVNAHQLRVAHDNDRIAQPHYPPADLFEVELSSADEKLGAVAVERTLRLVPGACGSEPIFHDCLGSRSRHKSFPPNMMQHAFEQHTEPEPARVDDARFAQHWEQ